LRRILQSKRIDTLDIPYENRTGGIDWEGRGKVLAGFIVDRREGAPEEVVDLGENGELRGRKERN
jgi:hypothetical protein